MGHFFWGTLYIHNIQPGAADMNHSIKLRRGCFVEFAFWNRLMMKKLILKFLMLPRMIE